jgi:hypothetical protein
MPCRGSGTYTPVSHSEGPAMLSYLSICLFMIIFIFIGKEYVEVSHLTVGVLFTNLPV